MSSPQIALILACPLLGLILISLLSGQKTQWIRQTALISVLASLGLTLYFFGAYDTHAGGYQFVQQWPWINSLGISLSFGFDGINLLLTVLTLFVSLAAILVSRVTHRIKEYYIYLMIVIIGTLGAFMSLDIFFFYFFHEVATVPVFIMMNIWGSQHKEYAANKLTLYLIAGASIALIGLMLLYHATGLNTFSLPLLQEHLAQQPLAVAQQAFIVPFIILGFGITLTLWPFYTWAPVGYAEAPTAVSMLHAGVLKKMGAYAIIRFALLLLPLGSQIWMPVIAIFAVINVLYCGFVALTQKDIKYLLSYSSCSHMGYVLLGLACYNTIGISGVVLLLLAHGLMASLAFALTGHLIHETKTRQLDQWGGLLKQMPFIGTCFVMACLASAGVPGFANFVSETMVFLGAWDQYRVLTILAILGIVITAIYMLKVIREGLHGPLLSQNQSCQDAKTLSQRLPFLLLLGALIAIGCWPKIVLKHIDVSVKNIVITENQK